VIHPNETRTALVKKEVFITDLDVAMLNAMYSAGYLRIYSEAVIVPQPMPEPTPAKPKPNLRIVK
jgi:hypothetical protein